MSLIMIQCLNILLIYPSIFLINSAFNTLQQLANFNHHSTDLTFYTDGSV
ncbi:21397_t:CDS:1, partial [Dentiscutata erythropus]